LAAPVMMARLCQKLAFRRHVGIEVERLQVDLRLNRIAHAGERLLGRAQADDALGAGDVGDEIDAESPSHLSRIFSR
jgi:hypothetical protein